MKDFYNLREGTVLHNETDGDMRVQYTSVFSEINEPEMFLTSQDFLYPAEQFDPADWEIKSIPVSEIEWDTDGEDISDLPAETDVDYKALCRHAGIDNMDIESAKDAVVDYLSDLHGFCIKSCII